jgi:hypothetical protein
MFRPMAIIAKMIIDTIVSMLGNALKTGSLKRNRS